jgi:hypothetical protein
LADGEAQKIQSRLIACPISLTVKKLKELRAIAKVSE